MINEGGSAARVQLARYVERIGPTPNLQYQFLPVELTPSETAAYLLLVASVNQGARAEAVGTFRQQLWSVSGGTFFGSIATSPTK